jgi:hypothetical protein
MHRYGNWFSRGFFLGQYNNRLDVDIADCEMITDIASWDGSTVEPSKLTFPPSLMGNTWSNCWNTDRGSSALVMGMFGLLISLLCVKSCFGRRWIIRVTLSPQKEMAFCQDLMRLCFDKAAWVPTYCSVYTDFWDIPCIVVSRYWLARTHVICPCGDPRTRLTLRNLQWHEMNRWQLTKRITDACAELQFQPRGRFAYSRCPNMPRKIQWACHLAGYPGQREPPWNTILGYP